jgi:hypothetical protein
MRRTIEVRGIPWRERPKACWSILVTGDIDINTTNFSVNGVPVPDQDAVDWESTSQYEGDQTFAGWKEECGNERRQDRG